MATNVKVRVLKRARKLIENRSRRYICDALDESAKTDKEEAAAWELMDLIHERLRITSTYESWLRHYHPEIYNNALQPYGSYGYTMIPIAVIAPARLAWIDSLIEEFKNE